MSDNKRTVTAYMEAFAEGDHGAVLELLAEDVVWEMPGVYLHEGKAAFDSEIENEGFVGRPEISIVRLIEEGDVVVAEGIVHHARTEGAALRARFCDVFELRNAKIKRLSSYLMLLSNGPQ